MPEMNGGCLCGQVRYSANTEPAFVGVCHCKTARSRRERLSRFSSVSPKRRCQFKGSLKRFTTQGTAVRRLTETFVPSAVRQFSLTLP